MLTALLPLATGVARGFNATKPANRTGLLAIDSSKAFDVIARDELLWKVNNTNLHPNLKRWLAAYMRGLPRDLFSKWRKTKTGVPVACCWS